MSEHIWALICMTGCRNPDITGLLARTLTLEGASWTIVAPQGLGDKESSSLIACCFTAETGALLLRLRQGGSKIPILLICENEPPPDLESALQKCRSVRWPQGSRSLREAISELLRKPS